MSVGLRNVCLYNCRPFCRSRDGDNEAENYKTTNKGGTGRAEQISPVPMHSKQFSPPNTPSAPYIHWLTH
ncbi:unnamed protein product [Thelazia callipaeda]|uniref:Uncharacterized protein n=1 Tax=Thelazia callipaeda TaxID=103827 RepID=A0A0N5CS76_THECL|nr:unnamed protein product [Thelazia callipaeda]